MTAAEPFARPQSVAEAVAGLEATGVAWTEGAAGDIDVLTQIGASEPVAAAPDDDLTTRVAATGTTSRPLSSRALAGVLAAVSLASLLALLLVWSPWSGGPSDSDTTPPATTSTSRTTPATSTMTSPPSDVDIGQHVTLADEPHVRQGSGRHRRHPGRSAVRGERARSH